MALENGWFYLRRIPPLSPPPQSGNTNFYFDGAPDQEDPRWRLPGLQDRTKTGPVPASSNSSTQTCSAAKESCLCLLYPRAGAFDHFPGWANKERNEIWRQLGKETKKNSKCSWSWWWPGVPAFTARTWLKLLPRDSPVTEDLVLSLAAGSWWHHKLNVTRRNEDFFMEIVMLFRIMLILFRIRLIIQ